MNQEDINEMISKNPSPEAEIQYQTKGDEVWYERAMQAEFEVKQLQAELERMKKAIRGALAIKQLWLYPMSKTVTIQQREEGKALWIMEKQFEQVLKEGE